MANQHLTCLKDFEQVHREVSALFFLFRENFLLVLCAQNFLKLSALQNKTIFY